jgi:hydroxyacylglutathione hydrolase
MALTLITIPCLTDNYAYLIRNEVTGDTALIDAPEATPIRSALQARGWTLTTILITHHHDDHVQGLADLRAGATVIGATADAHRLPPLDRRVAPGDRIMVCGEPCDVMAADGHTMGHVAFHFPDSRLIFTADSLMACGCGRLFEGTAVQMQAAFAAFGALPDDTLVCSGHEYAAANARFALTVDPDNAALQARASRIAALRGEGKPSLPNSLAEEKATNPYFRADRPALAAAVGLPGATAAEVFAEIRRRKDGFKG